MLSVRAQPVVFRDTQIPVDDAERQRGVGAASVQDLVSVARSV